MIVATALPYFAPYPGFFYKAQLADVLVILDSVQFPRGTTWLSRNRFKNDQGTLRLTVPVWKKGLGLQSVNEVRICHASRWVDKHLQSLETAYSKAPYLTDHLPFVERIYRSRPELLVDLNLSLIGYLLKQYGIGTRLVLLSDLGVRERGKQLIPEICRRTGASTYIARKSAGKYLDDNLFQKDGVALRFFRVPQYVYPQLWGPFVANLSSFDLFFNCGPKSRDILLERRR